MNTPEFPPLQLQLECHRHRPGFDKNFLPRQKMFGMEVVLQIFATFICCSAACCCSHSYIFIWSTRSDTLYAGCGCSTALMGALGDANGDGREEIYLGRKWMITGILLSLWAGETLDVTNTELIKCWAWAEDAYHLSELCRPQYSMMVGCWSFIFYHLPL